jgi:CRISPR-associated protein Cmr6
MALPLPRRQSDLQAGSLNLSLHFDHGYDGYDPRADWAHRKADPKRGIVEGKTEFLRTFAARSIDPKVYGGFLQRREAALELRSATRVESTSTAPLLVGLGRWNPTEIGFNLDRFTGCAFIPGSSVKGLLREAARLVSTQELPELQKDAEYWKGQLMKIFGRGTSDEKPDAEAADEVGSVVFFDAFPVIGPRLEIDVMTPHYGGYYGGNNVFAADWEDPVPVHFLRVPASTTIRFWFAARPNSGVNAADIDRIWELLPVALDWLGLGAKTSSGYGWFGSPVPGAGAERLNASQPRVATSKRLEWPAALLQYDRGNGTLYATQGILKAYAKGKDLETLVPADLLARVKDKNIKRPLTAFVIVEETGNDRRIVEVRSNAG